MISTIGSLLLLALASKSASAAVLNRQVQTQEAQYVSASFPAYGPEQDITGTILFTNENTTGPGVQITASLHNFPDGLGPFLWHVHVNPVPANGSCLATGAHFDPLNVGESPPCNPKTPNLCQVPLS